MREEAARHRGRRLLAGHRDRHVGPGRALPQVEVLPKPAAAEGNPCGISRPRGGHAGAAMRGCPLLRPVRQPLQAGRVAATHQCFCQRYSPASTSLPQCRIRGLSAAAPSRAGSGGHGRQALEAWACSGTACERVPSSGPAGGAVWCATSSVKQTTTHPRACRWGTALRRSRRGATPRTWPPRSCSRTCQAGRTTIKMCRAANGASMRGKQATPAPQRSRRHMRGQAGSVRAAQDRPAGVHATQGPASHFRYPRLAARPVGVCKARTQAAQLTSAASRGQRDSGSGALACATLCVPCPPRSHSSPVSFQAAGSSRTTCGGRRVGAACNRAWGLWQGGQGRIQHA